MKKYFTPILAVVVLLASCSTVQKLGEADLPFAQFEAYGACKAYIAFAVDPKDQADMKATIYAVASFVNSFAGGKVPTADQVKAQLMSLSTDSTEFVDLVNFFYNSWSDWFPSIKGDTKLAFDLTQRWSAGAMLATKPGTAMLAPRGYSMSVGLVGKTHPRK